MCMEYVCDVYGVCVMCVECVCDVCRVCMWVVYLGGWCVREKCVSVLRCLSEDVCSRLM